MNGVRSWMLYGAAGHTGALIARQDRNEDFAAPLGGFQRRASIGAGAGWESAAAAGRRTADPAESYRLGEDVVHAAFGDGVVTALEPGGIVVVRFAGDGSERKLLDSAPMSRR